MNTEIVYTKKEYKYTKECYLRLKNDLKELAVEQQMLKPQRKCNENLKVERKVQQHIAIDKVQTNKGKIRLLFIVYDELRGKDERVKLEESKLNYYKLRTLQKFKDEYLKETKTLS